MSRGRVFSLSGLQRCRDSRRKLSVPTSFFCAEASEKAKAWSLSHKILGEESLGISREIMNDSINESNRKKIVMMLARKMQYIGAARLNKIAAL